MEKIMPLAEPLSMLGAPEGDNPKIPEVGYYRPGNWIALYYGFIGYWEGKVPLGQIDASPDEIRDIPAGSSVTIELIDWMNYEKNNIFIGIAHIVDGNYDDSFSRWQYWK